MTSSGSGSLTGDFTTLVAVYRGSYNDFDAIPPTPALVSCFGECNCNAAPDSSNDSSLANASATDKYYREFYQTAQFVTGLIIYPLLCLFGLTGNVISIAVLSQRKMLTSTNVFLTALCVADSMKLLNDLLYFTLQVLFRLNPPAANELFGAMYPVSHYIFNQSVCVTSWLTVSVAVERYIQVCHATRAKSICTIGRARITSICVFLTMSLLAIPSALRYTTNRKTDRQFEVIKTELGCNEQFMKVYNWVQNCLRSIIPLFILVIINTCIVHSLRKQRVKGKKMSARNRITLMLITVVIVFLICITPDAIMSTFFGFGYAEENNLVKGVREYTDTLLALNSATNFVVYCAFSKVFRDTFMAIFCKDVSITPRSWCGAHAPGKLICCSYSHAPCKKKTRHEMQQEIHQDNCENCENSLLRHEGDEHEV
jgi:hypothetical protein